MFRTLVLLLQLAAQPTDAQLVLGVRHFKSEAFPALMAPRGMSSTGDVTTFGAALPDGLMVVCTWYAKDGKELAIKSQPLCQPAPSSTKSSEPTTPDDLRHQLQAQPKAQDDWIHFQVIQDYVKDMAIAACVLSFKTSTGTPVKWQSVPDLCPIQQPTPLTPVDPTPKRQFDLSPGTESYVGNTLMLASSSDAYDTLMETVHARDQEGYDEMLMAGLAIYSSGKMRVRILAPRGKGWLDECLKVRILSEADSLVEASARLKRGDVWFVNQRFLMTAPE